MPDNIGKLYQSLSKDPVYKDAVGNENDFRTKMADENSATKLYGALSKDPVYRDAVGSDYNQFSNTLGIKKKDVGYEPSFQKAEKERKALSDDNIFPYKTAEQQYQERPITPKQPDYVKARENQTPSYSNAVGKLAYNTATTLEDFLRGGAQWTRDNIISRGFNIEPLYEKGGTKTQYASQIENDPSSWYKDPLGKLSLELNKDRDIDKSSPEAYQLPNSFGGRIVNTAAAIAPDIILAGLTGGESAVASEGGSIIGSVAKKLLLNPFSKYLMAKEGLTNYAEAKRNGDTTLEANIEGAKGVIHGGIEGAKIAVLGEIAGGVSKLGEKGLVSSGMMDNVGNISKTALKVAANFAVFGASDPQHFLESGTVGAAFGIHEGINELAHEIGTNKEVQKKVIEQNQLNATNNLFSASPESVDYLQKQKATPEELNTKALELGKQAIEETDHAKKADLMNAALTFRKAADVKTSIEDIVKDKQSWIDSINNNDQLTDEQKADRTDKVEQIYKAYHPDEQAKTELGNKIQQHDDVIGQLNDVINNSTNHVDKAEAEVKLEDLTAKREDLNNQLKSTIKEQSESQTKIGDAVKDNGVYFLNGEKGELKQDGQSVVFETHDTIHELGNIDELSNNSISNFGLEKEMPLNIKMNNDNSIDVDGINYKNNYSNKDSAINYDKDGNVVSVNLETSTGLKRTFRGQRAEEIAYQYKLKSFEENATPEQIARATEATDKLIESKKETRTTKPKRKVENTEGNKVNNTPKQQENEKASNNGQVNQEGQQTGQESQSPQDESNTVTNQPINNATTEIQPQQQESVPTSGEQQYQGTENGQPKIGQGEGSQREVTISEADNSNKPIGSEGQQEEVKTTGIKKTIAENTRIEKNLPPIELPKLGSDKQILSEAKERVDSGKSNPSETVDRVINSNGLYSPEEAADIQYYGHQLDAQNEILKEQLHDANEELAKNPNSKEAQEAHVLVNQNIKQLNDQIDAKTHADRLNSNRWGKLGNIMQIETDASFNPANVKSIIADNYGGKVPKEIQAKLDQAFADRDKAIEDLKIATEKQIKREGEDVVKNIKKNIEYEERVNKRKQTKQELAKEQEDLLAELKKAFKKDINRVNSGLPLPTETLAVLGKLSVNYFKQGVTDFEGLTDRIYKDLKEDVEGLTKKQVREFLSSYKPLRESASDKEKERLGRKEKTLNKQIETGKIRDYRKKEKIVINKDNDILRAERRIANAEYKIRGIKQKSYEVDANKYQRFLGWASRWSRRSILSGTNVLAKLSAASVIGGAVKRLPEEAIGGLWSGAFKAIANKAPIEGNFNARAEAKFWKEFTNPKKFAKNSAEILKTGASDLTKMFKDMSYEHYAGFDAMMDLHAIIKDPLKRGVYETSLIKSYAWAERNGLDIQDPLVQQSLRQASYKRAEYEIFQEQTGFSKKFNKFLENEKNSTNVEATKKFLIKFLIPINTVPLNIARRVGVSITGLPRGLYNARKAYVEGIENLSNDQAEIIMRQLKKGSIGAALWSIGFLGAGSAFGGLWTKETRKKKEGELPFNEMQLGGVEIPHAVQHSMPLQLMQLGATYRKIYNKYDANPDNSELEKVINATMGSTGAVLEQIPIIETPIHAVEAFTDPTERTFLKQDLKNRAIPTILTDIGVVDKHKKKEVKAVAKEEHL